MKRPGARRTFGQPRRHNNVGIPPEQIRHDVAGDNAATDAAEAEERMKERAGPGSRVERIARILYDRLAVPQIVPFEDAGPLVRGMLMQVAREIEALPPDDAAPDAARTDELVPA